MSLECPAVLSYFETVYLPQRLLGHSVGTVAEYRTALLHWARFPGYVPLGEITSVAFASFLAWRLTKSSAATVNKLRRHLLAIIRFAAKQGLCQVPDVPAIPEYPKLPEAWTLTELERVVVAARQQPGNVGEIPARFWFPSLILCQYSTGFRIGALLAAESRNLSIPGRYLVTEARTQKHRLPECRPLSDQAVAAVAAIYPDRRQLVWPWPLTRRTFFRHFRSICKAAGVRHGQGCGGLTHKIRRTSGTMVVMNGGLIDAQQHLGHSSAAVTRDYYVDPRIARGGHLDKLPPLSLD